MTALLCHTLPGQNRPFFYSFDLMGEVEAYTPEKEAGVITIRGESRRLFVENLRTRKGEIVEKTFIVNKRDTCISARFLSRSIPDAGR